MRTNKVNINNNNISDISNKNNNTKTNKSYLIDNYQSTSYIKTNSNKHNSNQNNSNISINQTQTKYLISNNLNLNKRKSNIIFPDKANYIIERLSDIMQFFENVNFEKLNTSDIKNITNNNIDIDNINIVLLDLISNFKIHTQETLFNEALILKEKDNLQKKLFNLIDEVSKTNILLATKSKEINNLVDILQITSNYNLKSNENMQENSKLDMLKSISSSNIYPGSSTSLTCVNNYLNSIETQVNNMIEVINNKILIVDKIKESLTLKINLLKNITDISDNDNRLKHIKLQNNKHYLDLDNNDLECIKDFIYDKFTLTNISNIKQEINKINNSIIYLKSKENDIKLNNNNDSNKNNNNNQNNKMILDLTNKENLILKNRIIELTKTITNNNKMFKETLTKKNKLIKKLRNSLNLLIEEANSQFNLISNNVSDVTLQAIKLSSFNSQDNNGIDNTILNTPKEVVNDFNSKKNCNYTTNKFKSISLDNLSSSNIINLDSTVLGNSDIIKGSQINTANFKQKNKNNYISTISNYDINTDNRNINNASNTLTNNKKHNISLSSKYNGFINNKYNKKHFKNKTIDNADSKIYNKLYNNESYLNLEGSYTKEDSYTKNKCTLNNNHANLIKDDCIINMINKINNLEFKFLNSKKEYEESKNILKNNLDNEKDKYNTSIKEYKLIINKVRLFIYIFINNIYNNCISYKKKNIVC